MTKQLTDTICDPKTMRKIFCHAKKSRSQSFYQPRNWKIRRIQKTAESKNHNHLDKVLKKNLDNWRKVLTIEWRQQTKIS